MKVETVMEGGEGGEEGEEGEEGEPPPPSLPPPVVLTMTASGSVSDYKDTSGIQPTCVLSAPFWQCLSPTATLVYLGLLAMLCPRD